MNKHVKDKTQKVELAEADEALSNLLENLLAEVPEDVQPPALTEVLNKTAEAPITVEETVTETVVVTEQPEKTDTVEIVEPEPVEAEELVPEWASAEFKAMVFKVGNTRFAVPLTSLNSITPAPSALTPIPGQPTWHQGVMPYRDGKLVAVDIGRLLQLNLVTENPKFYLVIAEGRFGLACNELENPISVTPEQIRFRQSGDSQAWMVGMLPEQMCALLDLDKIENVIRHN